MFEEIYGLELIIQTIALEKLCFDYKEEYEGGVIDGDEFYDKSFEIVYGLCDRMEYMEYTDSTLYFFSFPEMKKFYSLCKEYCSTNHIKFQKCKYIKGALDFVESSIRCSGMRNIAWNYWIPPKLIKKRQHQFLIELGCYFEDWVEMIASLFEIRQYFREKCEELRKELTPALTIVKPKQAPVADTEERKAA